MFKDARVRCRKLVIALQGDPTIDRPNKCKPVQSLEDRKEILLSIKYVCEIVTYDTEEELIELLKTIPYDVRILGSDYVGKPFTGDHLGRDVYYHDRDHSFSLTNIKEKIYHERHMSRKENENV